MTRQTTQPPPVTMTIDATVQDEAREALDYIRRVRLFAQELVDAGFDVKLDGYLSIVVRTPPPKDPRDG